MRRAHVQHPDFAQPVTYDMVQLPADPDAQVAATISMMRRYAVNDSRSPEIVQLVNEIASSGDDFVNGVFGSAKTRMYFQRDEVTGGRFNPDCVEVLVRPVDVATMSSPGVKVPADCDCHSMYVASLLTVAGVPCAFATISAGMEAPDQFSHVYVVAWPGDARRIAIDASHGDYPGWEAPNSGRYQEWPVQGGSEVGAGGVACTLAFLLLVGGLWWMSSRSQVAARDWELN